MQDQIPKLEVVDKAGHGFAYGTCEVVLNLVVIEHISHCLDLDLHGKRPGITSDGNFSSYLIGRIWYNHFQSFSMGGNGNNTIYPLLST